MRVLTYPCLFSRLCTCETEVCWSSTCTNFDITEQARIHIGAQLLYNVLRKSKLWAAYDLGNTLTMDTSFENLIPRRQDDKTACLLGGVRGSKSVPLCVGSFTASFFRFNWYKSLWSSRQSHPQYCLAVQPGYLPSPESWKQVGHFFYLIFRLDGNCLSPGTPNRHHLPTCQSFKKEKAHLSPTDHWTQ